ncbi:MAG: energy transducer TonB, partial [Flavobacteriaceae bacterium]|nr:energy transducer TonB [Flavobacteriaceae bacterium]
KWNSRFFFQVGLIVSMLAVFLVMESTFGLTVHRETATGPVFEWKEAENPIYELEKAKVIPVKQKVKKKSIVKREKVLSVLPTITKNNEPETKVGSSEVKPDEPFVNTTPTTVVKVPPTINLLGVEFAPVFPGCEALSTNKEKIDCMSSKINSFIRKKFNTEDFDGLEAGIKHRIHVQFKIDNTGEVVDVKARASHPALEKEAMRVISKLPRMKPGKQGNTNVNVNYGVPIIFNLDY